MQSKFYAKFMHKCNANVYANCMPNFIYKCNKNVYANFVPDFMQKCVCKFYAKKSKLFFVFWRIQLV